jgi:hypothetical protein
VVHQALIADVMKQEHVALGLQGSELSSDAVVHVTAIKHDDSKACKQQECEPAVGWVDKDDKEGGGHVSDC